MPDADIITPYRFEPSRVEALDWVTRRWHDDGRTVRMGLCLDAEPWVKATAVRNGLRGSTSNLVVIADADVVTDGLGEAVAAVEQGAAKWAVPHRLVRRIARDATTRLLSGLETLHEGLDLDQRAYRGRAGGGIVVLARATYEACPLDPRFVGWGQEDDAWGLALRTMFGVAWRGTADLWHLWHEPQPRRDRRIGSTEGWRLYQRYRSAAGRPRQMGKILAEIHGASVA